MHMISVFRPENPADLALAESLLFSSDIPCFVHNRHVSSVLPGVQIGHVNDCAILVPEALADEAREILKIFVPDTSPQSGFWQTIRVVAEFLVFGWFVPAWRRLPKSCDKSR
ncbi:MAG: DUF2007 domain-containing protein [Zoogloeaceae bacterium]|jgi:hypothetical protein|nr:DUF2007 domain-containing protein [Zoogloeaceae bacterium]